jgi:DNA-binding beta-propeller fold protein YncE
VLDHRSSDGHIIQNVSDAHIEQREILESLLPTNRESLITADLNLAWLRTEIMNLKIIKDVTSRDITKAFDKCKQIIDNRMVCLQERLIEMYAVRKKGLSDKLLDLHRRINEAKEAQLRSTSVVKAGDLPETMKSIDDLKRTMHEVDSITQKDLDVGRNYLKFSFDVPFDFESIFEELGEFVDGVLPSRFKFSKHGYLVAGLPGKILMTVLDCSGNTCKFDSNLAIKVTNENVELVSSLILQENNYAINFVPQVSGSLQITPLFHGLPMTFSELEFTVEGNNPVAIYGGFGVGHGKFQSPRALALDKSGNIYVADTGNRLIQKLDRDGNFLHEFKVGGEEDGNSTCDLALGVNEDVIICTATHVGSSTNPSRGNTVAMYSMDGTLLNTFTDTTMKCGLCLATNSHHEIIISDYLLHSLLIFNPEGSLLRRIGDHNILDHPAFISIDSSDNTITVSDTNRNRILFFTSKGEFLHSIGEGGSNRGQLRLPFGVGVDGDGYVVVVDSGNYRVQVFRRDGDCVCVIESEKEKLNQPRGLVLTGDGCVLVADRDNHCIKRYRYK